MQTNIISRLKVPLLLSAGLCVFTANAQDSGNVQGRVMMGGEPLNNIRVSVENSFIQTQTDLNGNFTIQAGEGSKLIFSAPGYEQKIFLIEDGNEPMNILMLRSKDEPTYQIGYLQTSRTLLTSAISTTTGDVLSKTPVPTINDALQGNVSGLTVERTSGNEPGWSLSNYYIRGIGTFGSGRAPLFIVDGVERNITQLDAEEIESITVLKDAAATASFGIRGANGAVYVKTKRGYVGKPVVSLKANFGLQTPALLPDYLGSEEYVRFRNIALKNDGLPQPTDPSYDPNMYNGTQNPYQFANTDWYGEFIRKVSPQQMYRVSIEGGSEDVRYYVTLGVTNQAGIYNYTNENSAFDTNPSYSRYNVRANTDIDLTKHLTVSLDLGGKMETKRVPNASSAHIFSTLSTLPPIVPIKNEDGSIAGSSVFTNNPYGLLARSGYEDQYNRYLQGNVSAVHKLDFITKGLSANVLFGFDSYKLYARGKSQSYAVHQYNQDGTYSKFGQDSDLSLNFYSNDLGYQFQTTFSGGVSYENTFGVHDVIGDIKFLQSHYTEQGNFPSRKHQNLFGRMTYAYDKRYVAELGWSYSGSENFNRGNRFGFFPVASAAWVLSNEEFLSSSEMVNFMKVRASYGIVGNANIGVGRFPYMGQYFLGGGYQFGDGYAWSDGSYEGRLRNSNITFEKSLNANIGFDMDLFKSKLGMSVDLFRNDRSNIITTRDNILPGIIGQQLPFENLGAVLNRGFELDLKFQDKTGNWGYFVQANLSFARNKITYMEETAGLESWTYQQGKQVDVARGFEALGFFNTQQEIDNWAKSTYGTVGLGDIKYKDQNGDGLIDDNDLIPLSFSGIPELNMGITVGVSYKNFDLSLLFTGVANRTLIVTNNAFVGMQGNTKITNTAYDTWQQGVNESTAKYPRLTTEVVAHNNLNSTVWSHNGNYMRLQNVEFGYNLPKRILSKVNIMDARVFFNGYNLLSFDHLRKHNVSVANPNAGITTYPEMKVYNIGVNVKF